MVGLPEQAVKESIHRIERALANSGFVLPANRVVINLAPAELPKQAAALLAQLGDDGHCSSSSSSVMRIPLSIDSSKTN